MEILSLIFIFEFLAVSHEFQLLGPKTLFEIGHFAWVSKNVKFCTEYENVNLSL